MKSRIFLFLAIVSVAGMLAMSGCHPFDEETPRGRTGTLNGHEWVDFGLPSGTCWATCNVGANSREEYGDYFAWGETTTKGTYTWENLMYYDDDGRVFTKYNGFDNKSVLEARDDAATANWGVGWRMPTIDEINELILYTSYTEKIVNGVKGSLITGGLDGINSIFLPYAGYRDRDRDSDDCFVGIRGFYWSSSNDTLPWRASDAFYFATDLGTSSTYDRYKGYSVRPVCKPLN